VDESFPTFHMRCAPKSHFYKAYTEVLMAVRARREDYLRQPARLLHGLEEGGLLASTRRRNTRPHQLLEAGLHVPHLVEVYGDEVTLGERLQLYTLATQRVLIAD